MDNFENPKEIFGLRIGSNIATNGAISARGLRCELENVQEERRPPGSRFGESITCRSNFYMQEQIKNKIVFVCSEENFIILFISHCKKKMQKIFFPRHKDLDTCRVEC